MWHVGHLGWKSSKPKSSVPPLLQVCLSGVACDADVFHLPACLLGKAQDAEAQMGAWIA